MGKTKEVLDWYGNPIKGHGIGIVISDSRMFFMGEVDHDGKKYIRAYSPGGVPGDRIALEDCFAHIEDETGKVLYDCPARHRSRPERTLRERRPASRRLWDAPQDR